MPKKHLKAKFHKQFQQSSHSAGNDKNAATATVAAAQAATTTATAAELEHAKQKQRRDMMLCKDAAWKIEYSTTKGRMAVADRDLLPGTCIINEEAFVSAVLEDHENDICMQCFRPVINSETKNGNATNFLQSAICPLCPHLFVCSPECRAKALRHHSLLCKFYQQLPTIAQRTQTDLTLCKLLVALWLRQHLEQNLRDLDNLTLSDSHPQEHQLSWNHFLDLAAHVDLFPPAWQAAVSEAVLTLQRYFQTSSLSSTEFLHAAVRVNTNAHAILGDDLEASYAVGLGLFLRVSVLNHSCYPNCVFASHSISASVAMRVHTISSVPENTELSVSYVDLYSARELRQLELWQSKGFLCQCERCTTPIAFSVDRFIGGVYCACRSSANEDVKDSCLLVFFGDILGLSETSTVSTQSRSNVRYECLQCKKRLSRQQFEKFLSPLLSLLSQSTTAKRSRQYTLARKRLEEFLERSKEILPPLHYHVVQAHVTLYNLTYHLEDFKSAIDHCQYILSSYKLVFPSNWPEIADFELALGNSFAKCLQAAPLLEEIALQRNALLKEQLDSWSRCAAIRKISYGSDHIRTIRTANLTVS